MSGWVLWVWWRASSQLGSGNNDAKIARMDKQREITHYRLRWVRRKHINMACSCLAFPGLLLLLLSVLFLQALKL